MYENLTEFLSQMHKKWARKARFTKAISDFLNFAFLPQKFQKMIFLRKNDHSEIFKIFKKPVYVVELGLQLVCKVSLAYDNF